MFQRILVCGAGAIGGTAAAMLKRAGHEVVVVDANRDHVQAIRTAGLSISGPIADFTVDIEAVMPDGLHGTFDLILLAVLGYQTQTAVAMLASHLSAQGTIVSLQNGLNEPVIAAMVGAERTIGCFVHYGVDYLGPGRIAYATHGPFVIGELDGRITERLHAIHALATLVEPNATMTTNIYGQLWTKLAFGAINVTQAISDRPTQEFLDDPIYRPMICQVITEIATIAAAKGITLTGFQGFDATRFLTGDMDAMNRSISAYADARRGSKKTHTGVWQDIAIHKRKSETAHEYGPLLAIARQHGLSVPALAMAVKLIEAAENGERPLGPALAADLMVLVGDGLTGKRVHA